MPASLRRGPDSFVDTLAEAGLLAQPSAGTFTTLKMRTRFQAQADKEGEFACVEKDFVITPAATATREIIIGGRSPFTGANAPADNLGLLQASGQLFVLR